MSVSRAFKVLISHPQVPASALQLLCSRGAETIICKSVPPSRDEILEKVGGVDAILWAHYQPLNAAILDAAGPQLRAVSTMSSGIDFADVDEFKRRKIPLGHTPGVVKNSVADLAIGLMIAAGRHFHAGRTDIETWVAAVRRAFKLLAVCQLDLNFWIQIGNNRYYSSI